MKAVGVPGRAGHGRGQGRGEKGGRARSSGHWGDSLHHSPPPPREQCMHLCCRALLLGSRGLCGLIQGARPAHTRTPGTVRGPGAHGGWGGALSLPGKAEISRCGDPKIRAVTPRKASEAASSGISWGCCVELALKGAKTSEH